jgi:hypothetical protein
MTVTKEREILHWEEELMRAHRQLEEAKRYDDYGMIAWSEEQIRWAKQRLELLHTNSVK